MSLWLYAGIGNVTESLNRSLRGSCPKQSLLKLAKDCFGQDPRNDWWGSFSSVEDRFGFILEIL
ncbi:MAG: hypothetical protein JETT_1908 [Candidatus Jettenia ecosi]|uniref:Uncharacterized protein n=1 Tax=Candidatus Jettenia ecosi TaxID=2494326 RepID=A0A533QAT4_9BACT|nr:MAG: hypothetical protein JETT_1908 [Candidatus Jettenia ecosi]